MSVSVSNISFQIGNWFFDLWYTMSSFFLKVLRFSPIINMLHIHSCVIPGKDSRPIGGRGSTQTCCHPTITIEINILSRFLAYLSSSVNFMEGTVTIRPGVLIMWPPLSTSATRLFIRTVRVSGVLALTRLNSFSISN
jgi:hypothetical protein